MIPARPEGYLVATLSSPCGTASCCEGTSCAGSFPLAPGHYSFAIQRADAGCEIVQVEFYCP